MPREKEGGVPGVGFSITNGTKSISFEFKCKSEQAIKMFNDAMEKLKAEGFMKWIRE